MPELAEARAELGTDGLQLLFDVGELVARLGGGPHAQDVGDTRR